MAREERKKFPFSTQQKWMASVIFLLVAVILLLWIAIAIGSVVEMPGLMDVYLLEMNFPACSRTLRIGYYGMCGFHDGQFACHPTGPGSKPAELHDSLYSKIVHSEAHCPTLEAISAGLKLQYEVIYCVQMGALAIFLVGIGVSVVWAFAAKAAWYKTDLLREEEDEPLSRWESRVKHCIRLHRLSYRLQPLAWGFVVLSAVVCFASTLSVSQAAGALTYASEAFPMPMEIRVGRKVLILQGVELGLLVLLLVVFLVYVHRTKTAVWRLISIHPGDPKAAPDRMDHHVIISGLKRELEAIRQRECDRRLRREDPAPRLTADATASRRFHDEPLRHGVRASPVLGQSTPAPARSSIHHNRAESPHHRPSTSSPRRVDRRLVDRSPSPVSVNKVQNGKKWFGRG